MKKRFLAVLLSLLLLLLTGCGPQVNDHSSGAGTVSGTGAGSAGDPSGEAPGDDPSGEDPGDAPSGEAPGDDPSGEAPGDDPSGEDPGDDPSGEDPGNDPSGEDPGDDPSGEDPEPVFLMPSCTNRTLEDAVGLLESLELDLKINTIPSNSSTVTVNRVFKQSPAPGKTLTQGGTVILTYSIGPKVTVAAVPDLLDHTEAEALALLKQAGLVGVIQTRTDEVYPEGFVCAQAVPAGTELPVGAEVTFTVSAGSATGPLPDSWSMTIDDLIGWLDSKGLINKANTAPLGLSVGSINRYCDGVEIIWWDVEFMEDGSQASENWTALNTVGTVTVNGIEFTPRLNGPFAIRATAVYSGDVNSLYTAFRQFPDGLTPG